jgi:hypothetical protein
MRNHFHLGLSTPEGNLIAGMHWFETPWIGFDLTPWIGSKLGL